MTILTNGAVVIKAKEQSLVFPEIVHDDHNISFDHMHFIQTNPELLLLPVGTRIAKLFKLPDGMERVQSALYGPSAGDKPIKESEVIYEKRVTCTKCHSARRGYSRMVDKPTRPANNIVVIGIIGKVAFTIYGTQANAVSPKEPWDSGCTDSVEDYEYSKDFWAIHALSMHEN